MYALIGSVFCLFCVLSVVLILPSCSPREEAGGRDQKTNLALKLHGCWVMLLFTMLMVIMKR